MLVINPLPIVNPAPVWDLKSGCIAKDTSTNHFNTCRLSTVIINFTSTVPFINFIKCNSLRQSSSFGAFIRVLRTAITKCISGLARLQANRPFAIILW